MTAPTAELTALQDATDRLLTTAGALDDAALAEPSLLPGWTRGHVLAHVSRNADALVNVLTGRPMYPSAQAREADIERDADRPLAAHLTDLRESAARLAATTGGLTEEQWRGTVTLRNGVTDVAAAIPFRRRMEVELHHVDLDAGHTVADLPGTFTDGALDYLTRRFSGYPGLRPVEIRAEDGRSRRIGQADGKPLVVAGSPTALVGWLAGRTTGSGLTADGELPALPPL
ncbi:maleylpyruvate isomerase family mycothiol-dependent enzyme [Streptomyces sp. ACA25]|uniref:maleylpyruvate isomerase family mycothiol-dependent enzyme n=1 Tax=Streptomyces sp. ACA25 TaxID=3022596 RepID=UPI0023075A6E|nr:maleylpyruvate isomerase family mycothiol-dependent enzyme [Streptomyces sp. ACA25]MDB1088509.1 maleylpyruvate isomerase family mycothiol-dependent enzyme [Streptomyces sp. ACA25]